MEGLPKAILRIVKSTGRPMNIFEIAIEVFRRLGEAATTQDVMSAVQELVEDKLLEIVSTPSYKPTQ